MPRERRSARRPSSARTAGRWSRCDSAGEELGVGRLDLPPIVVGQVGTLGRVQHETGVDAEEVPGTVTFRWERLPQEAHALQQVDRNRRMRSCDSPDLVVGDADELRVVADVGDQQAATRGVEIMRGLVTVEQGASAPTRDGRVRPALWSDHSLRARAPATPHRRADGSRTRCPAAACGPRPHGQPGAPAAPLRRGPPVPARWCTTAIR